MKYSVFDLDNLGLIPCALASSALFNIASNKSLIATTAFHSRILVAEYKDEKKSIACNLGQGLRFE